jgi:hypothetical protein
MIVLPYFIDRSNDNWIKLNVFMIEGGRSLWYTEDTEKQVKKMLKANGFPLLSYKVDNSVIYANVDNTKLNLSEFYIWDEVDPKTSDKDLWRTYYIPNALWSCPIFKQDFITTSGLPLMLINSI